MVTSYKRQLLPKKVQDLYFIFGSKLNILCLFMYLLVWARWCDDLMLLLHEWLSTATWDPALYKIWKLKRASQLIHGTRVDSWDVIAPWSYDNHEPEEVLMCEIRSCWTTPCFSSRLHHPRFLRQQPTDGRIECTAAVAEKKVCDAKNHPEMMNSNKFYLHNHLCKYFKISKEN